MWLFVGLGNPGEKYEKNRHNIGFMTLDSIADGAYNFPPFRKVSKFKGELTEHSVAGHKMILLKPQTYMNESGVSVASVARFYKIPADHIIVFHDELDLKNGDLRMKKGGGNAGHNGLKSIQSHMGTPDFWRIRVGIDHPGRREMVSGYVLSDFAKQDLPQIDNSIDFLSDSYFKIIEKDAETYMKDVNSYKRPVKE